MNAGRVSKWNSMPTPLGGHSFDGHLLDGHSFDGHPGEELKAASGAYRLRLPSSREYFPQTFYL